MFEISVAVGICCVILGAWFLLRIGVAELILAVFLLGAGAMGVYWLWTGRPVSGIFEALGIFALLVITLGSIRLGIEKLSDVLPALFPQRFGTKDKAGAIASHVRGESDEHRHPAPPC